MKILLPIKLISSIALSVGMLGALFIAPAASATTVGFDPGRIIDDSVFTNKNSMTVQQIQTFLNSKVAVCDTNHADLRAPNPNRDPADKAPWTCLKDWVGPDNNGVTKSAAQVIYDAAQLFSINPQVLIVTLQKEQGLVTDTWPYYFQYQTAMGFACPDTAACDPAFFGFGKQVYQAARHFRNFFDENPNWAVPYKVGMRYVQYSPTQSCGGTNLNIVTHGTAALYNYTPYQPNSASLSAGYGTGDACSSYGNRNFYNYFTDWFGPTRAYAYQFVSATNPPSVMQPGQQVSVSIILKNTGGLTWWDETNAITYKDPAGGGAPTPMRLYTTQPDDHANPFAGGSGWVGDSRMTMLSGKASPGDSSLFQFTYTAPAVPGTYLEHFAPTIENVLKLDDKGMAFQVTVPKVYSYQFVSAVNPPAAMSPGQHATATVVLKNTGNVTWGNETSQPMTPFRLFTTRANDHTDVFGGGAGWLGTNRIVMQTATVDPGQNGTFSFDYVAPSNPGTYTDFFAPTMENVIKLPDTGMEFVVTVPPPYAYKFMSATNPPRAMTKGQTVTATITLMNMGSAVWNNDATDGSTPFRLFTTRPNDHNDLFGGGNAWLGKNRIIMQTPTAGYGQTAVFSFAYTAPSTAGTYEDFFAPTIENIIKLPDTGMEFLVTVQ